MSGKWIEQKVNRANNESEMSKLWSESEWAKSESEWAKSEWSKKWEWISVKWIEQKVNREKSESEFDDQ